MITQKTLGTLAAILVALGAVSYTTSKIRYGTTKGGGFVSVLDKPVDAGSIESIQAWIGSLPDSVVELKRAGEGWEVASRYGWKAKDDLVTRLLDDITDLKGEKRASNKAEILADFQIDDEKGLHVTAKASGGTELFHIVVGESAERGSGSFVRKQGSNDVFLTPAGLRSSFGVWGDDPKAPDSKRWIELRVHKAERNDVDKIVLKTAESEIVLEKEFEQLAAPTPSATDTTKAGTAEAAGEQVARAEKPAEVTPAPSVDRTKWTWKADAKGEFDKAKADGILSSLCSIYASDVANPDSLALYGLSESARVAEITFHDGKTVSIFFGNTRPGDDEKVYCRVGDGQPAEIYKSNVDRIFPSRDELKPKKEA
jgi:hypothetical protein